MSRRVKYRKLKPLDVSLVAKKEARKKSYGVAAARSNPLPLVPLAVGGAVVVLGGMALYSTFTSGLSGAWSTVKPLFSGPVLIGGGGMYAVGSALGMEKNTVVAMTAVGVGAGYLIQRYALAPVEAQAQADAAAQAQADYEANWRWYNPFTWA